MRYELWGAVLGGWFSVPVAYFLFDTTAVSFGFALGVTCVAIVAWTRWV